MSKESGMMKKTVLIAVCSTCLLSSIPGFAGSFSPEPLKISAPKMFLYEFDNSPLKMTVQVSGSSAAVVFSIFTQGRAEQCRNIRNGHLGWHYMNLVDTCIFISAPYRFQPGANTVLWDGRDVNGGKMTRQVTPSRSA